MSQHDAQSVTFGETTRRYEAWLAKQTPLLPADVTLKHQRMKEDLFAFFRATFYRWIQVWPELGGDLRSAPSVLAVGDLHAENFGTWRDAEGRLNWGINDFDEAYPLPYTQDLVRLAASARLAIKADHLVTQPKEACDALLEGYSESLAHHGRPYVLAEKHAWLGAIANSSLRDPVRFWQKLEGFPVIVGQAPPEVAKAVEQLMPEPGLSYKFRHRVSGLGSLGRPRYLAVADWHGGKVAREAKTLAPSACVWAQNGAGSTKILYQNLLDRAVRCRDPFVRLCGHWIVRRLSPHCCRIELTSLPKERDELRMFHAMGWETANIHLGSPDAIEAVRRDLAKRPPDWLRTASKAMVEQTMRDWEAWRAE